MRKIIIFIITLISVFLGSINVHAEENDQFLTIRDYCNYEQRGFIRYRTYSFNDSVGTAKDILDNAYYLRKTVSDNKATGNFLVIGNEGDSVSSLFADNQDELIKELYVGPSANLPGSFTLTYMSPYDFSSIDYENFDYAVYDMIIFEASAKDAPISYDMYWWLVSLTEKSYYIIMDRDILDEYYYSNSSHETICSYNQADKTLSLFRGACGENSTEEVIQSYIDYYHLDSMKTLDEDIYVDSLNLDFSEVEYIRLIFGTELDKYSLTPFNNLKEIIVPKGHSIKHIYPYACYGLHNIEFVNLNDVEAIDDYAFADSAINDLKLEKLSSIGKHAFEDCVQLSMLDITLLEDGLTIANNVFTNVPDACTIKWRFEDGEGVYYNLLPFNMSSYEVGIETLKEYNSSTYTITKGERTRKEYTITFDANGGACDVESMIVEEGGTYSNLPVPTREGFQFEGWIDVNGNVYKYGDKVELEEDVALFADWKAISPDSKSDLPADTNWIFRKDEIDTSSYNRLRAISNETVSMNSIYYLYKNNIKIWVSKVLCSTQKYFDN